MVCEHKPFVVPNCGGQNSSVMSGNWSTMISIKHTVMNFAPQSLLQSYLEIVEKKHRRAVRVIREELGFKRFGFPLVGFRNSETVFLLGSGASINQISVSKWQKIADHDSFGLNFWICHPFIPKFIFFEPSSMHLFTRFSQIANSREGEYKNTHKIMTMHLNFPSDFEWQLATLPGSWIRETWALESATMFARNEIEARAGIARLQRHGLFKSGTVIERLFKYMGTMTSMISLAVSMGYRNIVLCGVDMTSPDYFFHDESRYPDMQDIHSGYGLKHHTLLAERLPHCGADVVIHALNEQVVKPAGSKLYVESSLSGLYPEIPEAPDEVFL